MQLEHYATCDICSQCYMQLVLYATSAICSQWYMQPVLYAASAICSHCFMQPILYAAKLNSPPSLKLDQNWKRQRTYSSDIYSKDRDSIIIMRTYSSDTCTIFCSPIWVRILLPCSPPLPCICVLHGSSQYGHSFWTFENFGKLIINLRSPVLEKEKMWHLLNKLIFNLNAN